MTKDKASKLALEKIERFIVSRGYFDDFSDCIEAIKAALAQPQRPWVGLTEENLKAGDEPYFVAWREGAHWAETYLKDKNT
jgi:hypothetical protein